MSSTQNPKITPTVHLSADAEPYTPLRRSTASRRISLRSKGSLRGALVVPGKPRELTFESSIERDCALWLLTQSGIIQLDDQPPAIRITRPDGGPGQHTFDFLAHFDDGRRILIAVKDEDHAIRDDVVGLLKHIAPQVPKSIADGVMLYTERSISPAMRSNARLIQAVRRDPPHPADAIVRELVATVLGEVQVGALVKASGHGPAAYRAVVRLVADRVLELTADERIGYSTIVVVAAAVTGKVV